MSNCIRRHRTTPRPLLMLTVMGSLAFPTYAWANSGTPLMWAGMLHLLIGNALIGFLEGFLLARLFGLGRAKAISTMIAANYASAWLGGLFIRGAIVHALPIDLNNGWRWFWGMVVATYCLTMVLEWPFIAWCFRGTRDWARQSLKASLLVQSVSYVLLFGWYWMASGTSLYTRLKVVTPGDLSLPESVLVYYIAPADGSIYKRPLTGESVQKIHDLHSTDHNDRLLARPSTSRAKGWDLVARLDNEERRDPRFVAVLTNMVAETAPDGRSGPREDRGTGLNFGEAQSLGSASDSQWKFWTGFWPVEGLLATHKTSKEQVRFAYETPFGAWAVRSAVHLPSDIVLFQLGDDQICAFDPATRRVALLWHGRGAVPVIAKAKVE